MPSSTSHTDHPSARTHTSSTDVLAAQLANSQSATMYVEIEGLDEAGAAAMLTADPPLHVEWDAVRGQWAVRAATPDEVVEAEAEAAMAAEAEPAAKSAPTSATSKSSD